MKRVDFAGAGGRKRRVYGENPGPGRAAPTQINGANPQPHRAGRKPRPLPPLRAAGYFCSAGVAVAWAWPTIGRYGFGVGWPSSGHRVASGHAAAAGTGTVFGSNRGLCPPTQVPEDHDVAIVGTPGGRLMMGGPFHEDDIEVSLDGRPLGCDVGALIGPSLRLGF